MKRFRMVLSASLASALVRGAALAARAASYDTFLDKDEIVHKEAVSMVSELGIIAGLSDGRYAPKQKIDRASFARLICVTMNGSRISDLDDLKTDLTDTQGHWAEKYIAYCVRQGIIAGRGDGTFAPAANVTGSEAAKMLLVALGYDPQYEGIGGTGWRAAADKLASRVGLYDGLQGLDTSAPLTRDDAAQMICNALNAHMAVYE